MKPILEFPCLPNPVCTTIVVTSKPRRKAQDNLLPFKFLEKTKTKQIGKLIYFSYVGTDTIIPCPSNQNTPRNIFGTFLVFI